jgi:phospho-N-acetylmuramoyl-pentapeptide-transferase
MLYEFLYPLHMDWFIFNIFKYITVRAVGASVTSFMVCLLLGPLSIKWLRSASIVTDVKREHADKIHSLYEGKISVPTMGGILLVLSLLISNLLWGNFSNHFFWLSLGIVCGFGAIGFIDDLLKVKSGSSRGLSSTVKLIGQISLGVGLGLYLYFNPIFSTTLHFPFFKDLVWQLGIFFIPFVVLVLVGTSNALNLTDGLDGLAAGCLAFASGAFAILAYITGRIDFASYLGLPVVANSSELAVFCASMVGTSLGFLWYNSYPATIMMGDTGSLSLGGALGFVAIVIKSELTLLIIGGIFVWEASSVIIQVVLYRMTGKRVFLMAPFHHHLQLKGWSESKVTVRLWIVAFILALIGLSTLKLR